jgi:SH3-like domain-containing protein
MSPMRTFQACAAALALALALPSAVGPDFLRLTSPAAAQAVREGPSGLPLPRFVSLRSSRVNVRRGPGQDYDVAYIYVRAGMPVEIIQEFDNWRRIRDWEGDEGWVFHSLLSGRRTVMVTPWERSGQSALRQSADMEARIVAYLEPGVVAEASQCNGAWCRIRGEGFDGWIEQEKLWGVYPDETLRP